ncbi:MAG: hypothetical protein EAX87_12210 [Candidatus Thorarchaeota archaeon]|nr:hypothetical protein [Candidatus Thorarchaeota archaeon]
MQLVVQYTSELVTAVGLFIGAILLARFTWNRVKDLPPEEKHFGRPLWVAVGSVFFLGLTSLVNFWYGSGISQLEVYWYITAILGSGLLMISALMIMGSRRMAIIPIGMMAVIAVIAFAETVIGAGTILGGFTDYAVNFFALVLFSIPFALFSYLTFSTRRITSFALAVLSLTYPLILIATAFTDPSIVTAILGLRLYGPAILITALALPKSKIGAELIAYSFTVSSLLYFMTYLLVSPLVGDAAMMTSITLIALGAILSIGTGAYAFTRWSQSRNSATLTLGTFFFISGFSWLIVALNHVDFLGGLNAEYIALLLGLISPMLLNLSSVVALDWKRALLLPLLIMAAPFIMMLGGWTAQILPDAIPNRGIIMAISGILQTILPLGLYGLLWWRMRKAGAPGRNRALFLALGVVFLILGTAGGNAVSLVSSASILAAFGVWWLGVTGRADQLLGTMV